MDNLRFLLFSPFFIVFMLPLSIVAFFVNLLCIACVIGWNAARAFFNWVTD